MTVLTGFQYCSKCEVLKPVSDFRFDKRRLQYRRDCKDCERKARRQRYHKDREPERKGHTRYMQMYRQKPMVAWKNRLRQDTRTLILAGIIQHPGCCEACGVVASDATINCHHNSYLVPDNVTFLCEACHRDWHNTHQAPPEPTTQWVEEWYRDWKEYPDVDG